MAHVWFGGRWIAVDDSQLSSLASYGAAAAVHNHLTGDLVPWQKKERRAPVRQSRARMDATEGPDPQQLAELENRHEAVQQMQRDRRYWKQ
jgi:hypothetical protein